METYHNQPATRLIETRRKDARFSIQTTRLRNVIHSLEWYARLPIEHSHRTVIAARKEDTIVVHVHRVDDCVVACKVVHESSVWTSPFLDVGTAC